MGSCFLIFTEAEPTSSAFGTFPRGEGFGGVVAIPAFPFGEGVAAATDEVG